MLAHPQLRFCPASRHALRLGSKAVCGKPVAVRLERVVHRLWAVAFFLAMARFPASAVSSALLTWNPSVSPNVTGYKIYYGPVSGVYNNTLTVSGARTTNITVTRLTTGKTYYFAATALDALGDESQFSKEAVYSVPTNSTVSASQPPTLNALPDLTLDADAGMQVIILGGISAGSSNSAATLTVDAVSSNPSLIPNPTVYYYSPNPFGILIFAPTANSYGTATIIVIVIDDNVINNVVVRKFTVTVEPPNTPIGKVGPTDDFAKSSLLPLKSGLTAQTVAAAGGAIEVGAVIMNPPVDFLAGGATRRLRNGNIGVVGIGATNSNWTLWGTTNLTRPMGAWKKYGTGTVTTSPFTVDTGVPGTKMPQLFFRFSSP